MTYRIFLLILGLFTFSYLFSHITPEGFRTPLLCGLLAKQRVKLSPFLGPRNGGDKFFSQRKSIEGKRHFDPISLIRPYIKSVQGPEPLFHRPGFNFTVVDVSVAPQNDLSCGYHAPFNGWILARGFHYEKAKIFRDLNDKRKIDRIIGHKNAIDAVWRKFIGTLRKSNETEKLTNEEVQHLADHIAKKTSIKFLVVEDRMMLSLPDEHLKDVSPHFYEQLKTLRAKLRDPKEKVVVPFSIATLSAKECESCGYSEQEERHGHHVGGTLVKEGTNIYIFAGDSLVNHDITQQPWVNELKFSLLGTPWEGLQKLLSCKEQYQSKIDDSKRKGLKVLSEEAFSLSGFLPRSSFSEQKKLFAEQVAQKEGE